MKLDQRIRLAGRALQGLAIGDAFGESFFGDRDVILSHIQRRSIPPTHWEFTDDTVMAIAVYEQLLANQRIDQDQLAKSFASNHAKDPNRGYGATARRILRKIAAGESWQSVSQAVFEGMGSMGNGAAMRVAPIGAFFYDDYHQVKTAAIQSAELTHSHIEGIAGAIAVAVASALATRISITQTAISPHEFITQVAQELPDTDTRSKIQKSLFVPYDYHIESVKTILGNGTKILAQDTVPFSIWCAAHNLFNFEEALWKAISILGDRDTIGAIVGGITIMSSPDIHIPSSWQTTVEQVEKSIFFPKMSS